MLWLDSILKLTEAIKSRKYVKVIGGLISFILIRYISLNINRKLKKYPPGPNGVPLLGSFINLAKDSMLFYNSCANKYGSICMYYMGTTRIILISDPQILKQLYKNKDTLSRKTFDHHKYVNDPKGINWFNNMVLMPYSNKWKELRKLYFTTFITLLNSKLIENITKRHMNNYLFPKINECIKKNDLWYPHKHAFHSTFNIFFGASFGKLLDIDDKDMLLYINNVEKRFETQGLIVMLGMMDLTYLIPTNWTNKSTELQLQSVNIMIKWYKKYLNYSIDPYQNIIEKISIDNDIDIDESLAFKLFIDKALNKNNHITAEDVIKESDVFFTGGLQNVSETAEYSLLLLAKYPNVQNKLYSDLTMLFNNYDEFNLSKINKCHSLKAFIYESIRISSGAFTGLPRIATNDIQINNYIIPKNSIIIPYLYYCSKYCKNWKTPQNKLNLNNWLDDDDKFKMNQLFVSFSTGKRECIGRTFAINYLCAFIAILILKYKFNSKDNKDFDIKQKAHFVLVIDEEIGIFCTER